MDLTASGQRESSPWGLTVFPHSTDDRDSCCHYHVSGLFPAHCGKQYVGFHASRVWVAEQEVLFQGAGKRSSRKHWLPLVPSFLLLHFIH